MLTIDQLQLQDQAQAVSRLPAIEVKNLARSFNGLRALDGINFAVCPGEMFGFLGPNGAGKTTTIRILTGQLRPTSGTAQVAAKKLSEVYERVFWSMQPSLRAKFVETVLRFNHQSGDWGRRWC